MAHSKGLLIPILLLTTVVFSVPVLSMTNEEIFNWVAREFKIEKDYPMPGIKVVPREELQREFKKEGIGVRPTQLTSRDLK